MTSRLTRRTFIGASAVVAAAAAIRPSALLAAEVAEPRQAELGLVKDLDSGEPVYVAAKFENEDGKVLEEKKVFVRAVRAEGEVAGWVVLSAICTHLKCRLEHKSGEDVIVCPCHNSTFDLSGRVLKKPARKDLPDFSKEVVQRDGKLYLVRNS